MDVVLTEPSLTEEDIREPINKLLSNMMVSNGRIDLASMSRSDIDYAIHMLRQYGATKYGERLADVA